MTLSNANSMPDTNPLLSEGEVPLFREMQPQHVEQAIRWLVQDNLRQLEKRLSVAAEPLWQAVIQPLHNGNDRLDKAWSIVSHLNAVVQTPEWRLVHDACLPVLSEYSTCMGQHRGLYDVYKRIRHSGEFLSLSIAQQKTIDNAIRDFHLTGVDLPEEQKQDYGKITARLSQLASIFSNNVLDATKAWKKHIQDKSELAGLPETALEMFSAQAATAGMEGWLLTLDAPSYMAVITYADNPALRREIYEAYVTRASDCGPHAGQFDNTPVMEEILQLRHHLAMLLGFDSYAGYSLATKMAESPEKVCHFLGELAAHSRHAAENEWASLCRFARETCSMAVVESWDVAWLSERFRKSHYSIDKEQLREYFPLDTVLTGLFTVAGRLFGVTIEKVDASNLWHPDAAFYNVHRKGQVIASFYTDLFARENKRSGAWMGDCRVRRMLDDGSVQLPVAFLVCNFAPPVGDRPSLLTFDEVTTLFHEFGHGFHHMLSRVDCAPVSGINGVAWDAVELPSQWLENWCWQREVIPLISAHYRTGQPLPEIWLDKLLEAKHFQTGLQMLRQIEFSLFDMVLHQQGQHVEVQQVMDNVRSEVSIVKPPAFNRFQNAFSHIFAGGYAAGYYSYKWAELLAADAFSLFEERGLFDETTSASFCTNILERGGEENAAVLFRSFRGRDPEINALLRHNGISG